MSTGRLSPSSRTQSKKIKTSETKKTVICPASFVRGDLWKRHMSVSHNALPSPSSTQLCGSSCPLFAECHCDYSSGENDDDGSANNIGKGKGTNTDSPTSSEVITRFGPSLSLLGLHHHQQDRGSRVNIHNSSSIVGDLLDRGATDDMSGHQGYNQANIY
ncbi:hypothetical protein K505DRAFT_343169 [Melanomma pulvis-pyrius CBS 109.77]|uniref:Uncharacterized protein n=1 Tax=Melanomma pulvis-pyrius CBS 109.77 TaxID=1314802 RepID=A0A6A6WTB7_9PLEO|nr:hypothetical protein K505DRAFT_343169 [Melanomma pulvis-pyrius CBS 109.77]